MATSNHPERAGIDLLDGRFYADEPHAHFDWMRANAPVYWDRASSLWGVSLHEDIMMMSRDATTFSNAQGMRPEYPAVDMMICMDDPEHKVRRNLVNRGFTKNRVERLEPKVRAVCRELIDAAMERGRFDFVREIAAPLPMIMIGDMLGVPPDARGDLLRWSDDMMKGMTGLKYLTEEAGAAMMQAGEEYRQYVTETIVARRTDRSIDDLMGILTHAEVDGARLDEEAISQESLLILIGGDETTRHVISGGMHALLEHPEQLAALREDPTKLPVAIEEMLRWVSPIKNMARTLTRDVELRGQTLEEGEKLLLLYPSGNRDERVFDRPHEFDITRTPNDHVAFGGYGTHFCLGASLARLELRVMFEELLDRLGEIALTDEARPVERPANFVVGFEEMWVEVAHG